MPGSRGFLAAVLKPGLRAVSVPATATSTVSGFIYAGDRVDVLLTHALTNGAGSGQHNATETILRNARVIAMDQKLDFAPGDKPDVAKTATLELTAKQTEIVTLAVKMGELSLVLRSLQDPEDEERDVGGGDDATAELGDSYTHDSQVSRLIKDPSPPPKPPTPRSTRSSCCAAAGRTKQELDGSIATTPMAAPSRRQAREPSREARTRPSDTTFTRTKRACRNEPVIRPGVQPPTWRRVGSSLALAASLPFAFQPSLLLAQVQMSDPDQVPAKPKPPRAGQEGRVPADRHRQCLGRSQPPRVRARRAGRARDEFVARHGGAAGGHAGAAAGRQPVEAKPVESKSAAESAAADRRRHSAARADRERFADARRRRRPARSRRAAGRRAADGRRAPQFAPAPTPSPAPAPAPVPIQPPPAAAPRRRRRW